MHLYVSATQHRDLLDALREQYPRPSALNKLKKWPNITTACWEITLKSDQVVFRYLYYRFQIDTSVFREVFGSDRFKKLLVDAL